MRVVGVVGEVCVVGEVRLEQLQTQTMQQVPRHHLYIFSFSKQTQMSFFNFFSFQNEIQRLGGECDTQRRAIDHLNEEMQDKLTKVLYYPMT